MTFGALAAALLLASAPAFAHKLKVFAAAEGADIVGTAYFAGGGKAAGGAGRITAGDGAPIAEFMVDGEGGFRVPVPTRQDYVVRVDAGDGHVAEARIGAAELAEPSAAPNAAGGAGAAEIEAAVARQIRPLRQQIDAMEERARFSDIMGGIGTIFGVFGIVAWIASRRGRKA